MPIPNFQDLMLPVLRAAAAGEARIGDVVEILASSLSLPEDDRNRMLSSGSQTVFSNRVNWAKTYLAKAGLVEAVKRGTFRITPRGAEALKAAPAKIDNVFPNQFEEFRAFRR